MARLNKTCLACQTRYSYCPTCSRADALKPSWSNEFCCESCMSLWMTLTRYGMSTLTKSEAKSIISDLDLKPIDEYAECVQRDYAKVMAVEKKIKKSSKKFAPIVEVEQIEQPAKVVETVAVEPEHAVVIEKENE